jgi:hypothetical protein
MSRITVAELRHYLRNLPDDALIMVPGEDHSFKCVFPGLTTAVHAKEQDYFFEHYEEIPLQEDEVVIDVVVFD